METVNFNNLVYECRNNEIFLLNRETGRWYIGEDNDGIVKNILNRKNTIDFNIPIIKKLVEDNILITNKDLISEEVLGSDQLGLLILDTTSRCNLACKYCFANATTEGSIMEFDTAIKALELSLSYEKCADVLTIEFSGGEPLLNYDLIKKFIPFSKEIAKKYNKKLTYTIQTNGTLLNDDIIDFLIRNDVNIGISVDGNKMFHDKNRIFPDGSGSIETIIKNINKIQNKGSHVSILAVISSSEQYESVIDFAIENNIRNIRTNLVNEVGRAKDLNKFTLEYEKIAESFVEMAKKIIAKEIILTDATLTFFLWNLMLWKMHMCFRSPCGAGTNQISIASNGDLFPCQGWKNLGDYPVANVFDINDLNSILLSNKRVNELRNHRVTQIDNCQKCDWKMFCGICPREIYSCTGDTHNTIGECIFEKLVFKNLVWEFKDHLEDIKEYLLGN